ncbi:TPA: hypothetical protein ACH3X1_011252 [Trebouxia sp. C0004]
MKSMLSHTCSSIKESFSCGLYSLSAREVVEAVVEGERGGQVDELYCKQQADLHKMQAAFTGILAGILLCITVLERNCPGQLLITACCLVLAGTASELVLAHI